MKRVSASFSLLLALILATALAGAVIEKFGLAGAASVFVVALISILAIALWAYGVLRPKLAALRNNEVERMRLGRVCPTCGYNMRATPDRCPECGKSPHE